jgi:phosphate transport system protein
MPGMAKLALELLKASLDAFVNRDPAAARAIIPRDKGVDALNKQITRDLVQYIMDDREAVMRCLNLITISRSLERIADHATNVAEEVVYLCEAQDIRHTKKPKAAA